MHGCGRQVCAAPKIADSARTCPCRQSKPQKFIVQTPTLKDIGPPPTCGPQVCVALRKCKDLPFATIGTGHGPLLRYNVPDLVGRWVGRCGAVPGFVLSTPGLFAAFSAVRWQPSTAEHG